MPTSQNGYTANNPSKVSNRLIPHTIRKVTVVNGAPGDLLLEWAAWFDKFVEDIEGGVYDDWGYAERPVRGYTTVLSNHASGTAIDLNATQHPLGHRGTFTPQQAALIRKELRRYGGCIRWGGDYQNRADEMHFEIVRGRAACRLYLTKIRLTKKETDMSLSQQDINRIAEASRPSNWTDKDKVAFRKMFVDMPITEGGHGAGFILKTAAEKLDIK